MLSGSKSGEFLHNAIMKHFIICLEINQMAEIECIFISLICCNYCNIHTTKAVENFNFKVCKEPSLLQ